MNRFRTSTESQEVVPASREEIWKVLTDPVLLPKLTPFLSRIEVNGDLWRWEMSRIPVVGISFAPAFTERMMFDEPQRIEYSHEPPGGAQERAGVNGWYDLQEADHGRTHLAISLGIEIQLPLPRAAGPAVRTAMKGVIATMGLRFSANLLKHLDAGGRRHG